MPGIPALSMTDELWCNPDPCDSMQSENVPGDSGAEPVPQESRVKLAYAERHDKEAVVLCTTVPHRGSGAVHNITTCMYCFFSLILHQGRQGRKKLFDVVGRFVLHWPAL